MKKFFVSTCLIKMCASDYRGCQLIIHHHLIIYLVFLMSNRTAPGAVSIHGSDPQFLIEKIVRERIYGCAYWKEKCFGLTAESILDRALELDHAGGCYGAQQRPTEFLCLLLKLLQLQPSEEIILTYIAAEEYKYLRLLGAVYYRFVFGSVKVYGCLEPLLVDFRRIRLRQRDGTFALKRFDELIWGLLREEKWFDTILPRLVKRLALEDSGDLCGGRESIIESEFNEQQEAAENELDVNEEEHDVEHNHTEALTELEEENALRAKLGLKPLK